MGFRCGKTTNHDLTDEGRGTPQRDQKSLWGRERTNSRTRRVSEKGFTKEERSSRSRVGGKRTKSPPARRPDDKSVELKEQSGSKKIDPADQRNPKPLRPHRVIKKDVCTLRQSIRKSCRSGGWLQNTGNKKGGEVCRRRLRGGGGGVESVGRKERMQTPCN